jgi:maleylacetate reductase
LHSVLLPYTAAFNREAAPEAMARLAGALHGGDAPTALWELADRLGAPRTLAEIGFDPAGTDAVVAAVTAAAPVNPRPVDGVAVRAILAAAWAGGPPIGDPVATVEGAS